MTETASVLVIPGLAVYAYAELPVQHLRENVHNAQPLAPPACRDNDLWRCKIIFESALGNGVAVAGIDAAATTSGIRS